MGMEVINGAFSLNCLHRVCNIRLIEITNQFAEQRQWDLQKIKLDGILGGYSD